MPAFRSPNTEYSVTTRHANSTPEAHWYVADEEATCLWGHAYNLIEQDPSHYHRLENDCNITHMPSLDVTNERQFWGFFISSKST